MRSDDLVPLPAHPSAVEWPTRAWPTADPPPAWDLPERLAGLWDDRDRYGTTFGVAVAHRGRLVYERYGGALEHWDRPPEPVGPTTGLLSWSVAKSVLHAAVGLVVGDGGLHPASPAPVPAWAGGDDPRGAITLEHLLAMRDGLDWVEDYDPEAGRSDVIEMLFGGQGSGPVDDVAHFAADRMLVAEPGTRFAYSSGTSNIVSGLVSAAVGDVSTWLARRLWEPLGMHGARVRTDRAGTWIASSFLYAPARDWLRFGELYLRGGVWEDGQLLPSGWVDHGRRPRSVDEEGGWYGAHWWMDGDELGSFWASGYEGQTVTICPGLDLVVVRFGKTAEGSTAVPDWRRALLDGLAAT